MNAQLAKRSAFAQAAAQRKLKDWDGFLREQRDSDLRWILSTEQGRRFVWDLLERAAGVFGRIFTGNSETFFKEGRRHVGVELLERVQRVAPESYVLMVDEAMRAARERQSIQTGATAPNEGNDE